ncbi:MAG TPA: hypothetical protein VL049_02870 [Candidatus Dormibacteraeota bacterium]|nr:hypothetical protein [Candidatus Dormibacteraeota bacterium]
MQAHTQEAHMSEVTMVDARERLRLIGSGAILGLVLALLVGALGGLGLL